MLSRVVFIVLLGSAVATALAPPAAGASTWNFNLPATHVSIAGGFSTGYETGPPLAPYMAATKRNAATGMPDTGAHCQIGVGVGVQPPYEGTFEFEMGLALSAHSWHAVQNALVIGFDGTGFHDPFSLQFWFFDHGEARDPLDGVWLSTDGANWHHVQGKDGLGNTGFGWSDWSAGLGQWGSVSFDLSQAASSASLNLSGQFYVAVAEQGDLPIGFFDGVVFDLVTLTGNPWTDLGNGLAGTSGVPLLNASGQLTVGNPTVLSLSGARPNASATMIVGLSQVNLPFFGGVLVPSPDLFVYSLPIDASGNLLLTGNWPPGVPSGTTLYFQFWIDDPLALQGYAASNAVMATTP